jgi:SagB-type dehydrogenase family enzyme
MQQRKTVRFRRSPYLVCYWSKSDGTFVIQDYFSSMRIGVDPIACKILDFFDDWRPLEGLYQSMSKLSPPSLQEAVAELARISLLERSDRPQSSKGQAMRAWEQWNPAAGLFHFSTKNVRYTTDPVEERRFLRSRAKQWPLPQPTKCYRKARKFHLPMPAIESELPRVLLARRTWRRFSKEPIALSSLGILMRLTWGVQRWTNVPGFGRLALKTSPSGGARHPIEVYVVARHVAGLPRGLYHYAADTHQLELLKKGTSSGQIAGFLPGQWWYGSAGALMLMTAVFARTQWKYRSPRAYRAVLLEAGHLCQTFCIVATWLHLAPFCTLALNDSRVEKHLGLDGIAESVIYAAGVGARPPGVDWAPEPKAVL